MADQLYEKYGWSLINLNSHGGWSLAEVQILWDAATAIEGWFANNGGGDAIGRMRATLGNTQFSHADMIGIYLLSNRHHVRESTVYLLDGFTRGTVVHEMAHVLDNRLGFETPIGSALFGGGVADDMARTLGTEPTTCFNRSRCTGYDTPAEPRFPGSGYGRNGPSEDFGDTFVESVLNSGGLSSGFSIRAQFMVNLAQSLTTNVGEFSGAPYSSLDRYGGSITYGGGGDYTLVNLLH